MRYLKNNASPRDVLNAATALFEASAKVAEAISHLDGKVKVALIDRYIKDLRRLRSASAGLEGDFASCVRSLYRVDVSETPLFGSAENLKRAAAYLDQLERRGGLETDANPVRQAINAAGGQVRLADALGVTQQAVSAWLRRGWVPTKRAMEIEYLYGVPRQELINPRLANLILPEGSA